MSRKFVDIRTDEPEAGLIEKISGYLKTLGFQEARSKNKHLWKKGVLWTIFASCQFTAGIAHIEVYNYAPIPGMESSSGQATLGKKVFHIKVTDTRGHRLSFGKASARFWSKAVSFFILGIGFIITAFTGKKQALHDLIAGTLVVQDQF